MRGVIESGGPKVPAVAGGKDLDNLEGMDLLGITLPIYKIEYKRSPKSRTDDTLKEGLFTSSLGGQKERLRCVLLRVRPSRIYWPAFNPQDDNPQPLCKSNDARIPDADSPESYDCPSCPLSQWNNTAKNPQDRKPKCALVWNLLCLDLDTPIPFVLSVKRTSVTPFKNYLTRFRLTRKPTYSVETIISIKPIENYYILNFEPGEELRKQDIDTVAKYAEDYADAFRKTDVSKVSDADENEAPSQEEIEAAFEQDKKTELERQAKRHQEPLFEEDK